ncbi:hypothetical protein TIFTF001_008829 [Ficus carica]|uniref:Uncharacterized protein n=1 Tax=Ficus carica TaxID=3494 RepID=A0AA88A5P5_FICCA|nr:hypothetical protein TIFTF001_008829 [Ficus carica]
MPRFVWAAFPKPPQSLEKKPSPKKMESEKQLQGAVGMVGDPSLLLTTTEGLGSLAINAKIAIS